MDAHKKQEPLWRTSTVFISSTFQDMQQERDWLKNHVFPRLEEELRKNYRLFVPVDLRLGIDTSRKLTDEDRELLVLKVCLNEVERARPYLIVLLGDRYGTVPPEERIATATQEAGFAVDGPGRSVTALEIECGLSRRPNGEPARCFLYFRDTLPYGGMLPETAARFSDAHATDPGAPHRVASLARLKTRLTQDEELQPRIRRYAAGWDSNLQRVKGLEAFGERVFADLLDELQTPDANPLVGSTPMAEDRAALRAFVELGSEGFVGREELTRDILDLAHSAPEGREPWGACVVGAAGSGKSALFAHVHRQLADDDSVLLLSQAGGLGQRSRCADMLVRWVEDLAAFLGLPAPATDPGQAELVYATFVPLLAAASR
jgi:hypothetical protein